MAKIEYYLAPDKLIYPSKWHRCSNALHNLYIFHSYTSIVYCSILTHPWRRWMSVLTYRCRSITSSISDLGQTHARPRLTALAQPEVIRVHASCDLEPFFSLFTSHLFNAFWGSWSLRLWATSSMLAWASPLYNPSPSPASQKVPYHLPVQSGNIFSLSSELLPIEVIGIFSVSTREKI